MELPSGELIFLLYIFCFPLNDMTVCAGQLIVHNMTYITCLGDEKN